MLDISDEDRRQVLGEVMLEEFKALREGIANLPTRTEFNVLRDKVADMADDIISIKGVLRVHSRDINFLKSEMANLSRA